MLEIVNRAGDNAYASIDKPKTNEFYKINNFSRSTQRLTNPFDSPLHILEIFTTESFLSLNNMNINMNNNILYDNSKVEIQPAKFWEIEPFESKEIISILISSKIVGIHLGKIVNHTKKVFLYYNMH